MHRLTGIAPSVALHFPWDRVDDLNDAARARGGARPRLGAINPNLFQDPDYKLGSLCHPDAGVRRRAVAHVLECVEIAASLGSNADLAVARRRDELSGPGLAARSPAPARSTHCARSTTRCRRRHGAARRVQVLRAGVLRDRPRRLGLRAARLPGSSASARRCSSISATTRQGVNIEQIVSLLHGVGSTRRLPLQRPQVRRRRSDRRLDRPVPAVPDLLSSCRRRARSSAASASRSTSRTTSSRRSRR